MEAAEWVVSEKSLWRNGRSGRRRLLRREGVGCSVAAVGVGESELGSGGVGDVDVGDERRCVGVNIEEDAAQAAVEEHPRATAHAGFAAAEHVPGKADARHEVRVDVVDSITVEAGIAGKL